jgi:hypothetical protein
LPLLVLAPFQHIHGIGYVLVIHDRVPVKHRGCFPASDLHRDLFRDVPPTHVPSSGAAQIVEVQPWQTCLIAYLLPASAEVFHRLAIFARE